MGFGHGLEGPAPAQLLTAIQRLSFEENLLLHFLQGSRHSPPLHGVYPIALRWSQLPKTNPSAAFSREQMNIAETWRCSNLQEPPSNQSFLRHY